MKQYSQVFYEKPVERSRVDWLLNNLKILPRLFAFLLHLGDIGFDIAYNIQVMEKVTQQDLVLVDMLWFFAFLVAVMFVLLWLSYWVSLDMGTKRTANYFLRTADELRSKEREKKSFCARLCATCCEVLGFVYVLFSNLGWAVIWGLAQYTKVLPLALGYFYNDITYQITDELLEEYELKLHVIEEQFRVQQHNQQVQQLNDKIDHQIFNLEQDDHSAGEKHQVKTELKILRKAERKILGQVPVLPATPIETILRIAKWTRSKQKPSWTERLLHDAYYTRLTGIQELLYSVFYGLPKVILQFYINVRYSLWKDYVAQVSFSGKALKVAYNCYMLSYDIFQNHTKILFQFIDHAQQYNVHFPMKQNALKNFDWVLGEQDHSVQVQGMDDVFRYDLIKSELAADKINEIVVDFRNQKEQLDQHPLLFVRTGELINQFISNEYSKIISDLKKGEDLDIQESLERTVRIHLDGILDDKNLLSHQQQVNALLVGLDRHKM